MPCVRRGRRRPHGRVRGRVFDRVRVDGLPLPGLVTAGALAGLPAFAVAAPPSRVRTTRRARHAATPVYLERDRRDPRRHGTATLPDAPPAPAQAAAAPVADVAGDASPTADAADQYPSDVAA